MMFKGTKTIGVKDYESAMKVQKEQDEIRAKMEEEYTALRARLRKGEISGNIYDPENMTPKLKELRARLEELFKIEKEHLISNEIDEIYTREGALAMNAGTYYDWTLYFIGSLPANKLELWFWLESDRLLNPVFREFYSERDVVREERRQRVESTPTGKLDELFEAMFWQSVPYSWPVIGWPSDVESITRAQAEEYFGTYYAPNNLTAVLVGDFDSDEVLELANRYFGRIPKGETPVPEMITTEMKQEGEKRLFGEAETNPTIRIRYHVPAFNHRDTFPLQMLADALDGRTGRLYKALVEEKDLIVGEPYARLMDLKYAGYFEIGAEIKEGREPAEVEAALLAEIESLREEPLEDLELQKVKNQAMADSYRRLLSNFFLLQQLLIYDATEHWSYINTMPTMLQQVTVSDVQDVAKKYLEKENRNLGVYLRKADAEPEDPALAELPPQAKSMVKQQLAEIEKATDPAELEQGLQQMMQMQGQAPPQMKPAIDYLIQKVQERIEQLSKESAQPDGSGAQ
jgi:predicted Zn-dependent peptidase